MIVIKFPTDGTSRINVYENEKLIIYVERKMYLFTVKGDFFVNNTKVATVTNNTFSTKIQSQNLEFQISKISYIPFKYAFLVNNDKISIIFNLLGFIFPCFYSKIYLNKKLVANVRLKRVLNIDGVTLIIDFNTIDDEIKIKIIITYLMTCLTINI